MLKNITPARTLFLSVEGVAAIMKKKGAAACIEGIAQYISEDFLRWEDFDKTARVASHSDDGVIELMPIADKETYTFKYVNGHPRNSRFGLSTVMAFGVLSDVETGTPELLSELTLTTAMRTAAMSAVAAKALAKPQPKSMALIGNGAQSEFQALAFSHLLGVKRFHLYDIDPSAMTKLQHNLDQLGLESQAFSSTCDAVQGTDIVTTVTADKTNATIITPDMIEPGMHINGVGGDCPGKTELHCDVLRSARVFVEYEPQSRVEGDVQQMPPDFPVTEIWRVLAGHAPGRQSLDDVTIFDSVGFALEDFSALRFMRDVATTLDLCESISLVPSLEDPRNLFGFAYEKNAGQTRPLRDVVAY